MNETELEDDAEEIAITLTFKEVRLRGETAFTCVVVAEEDPEGTAYPVMDTIEAPNWDVIKTTYPTLEDVLTHMFWSENWRDVGCGTGHRDLYIESIKGHEGLYHYQAGDDVRVSWDAIKDIPIVYLPTVA